ncbi:hypothetical protein JI435_416120 [Parastagonospora nodorum SN15]|uniref:Uncharacterized protein n=1 Tax=Phaeosphaeria nodorum (strain SN15 / ATCC MYA-4574 / FGSC 10173) TaxID=321614 RepID=A0A7U2FB59_PHANO|nr:hypothetical protein JI435_416120 [Parastagonospora nodorum SN15]
MASCAQLLACIKCMLYEPKRLTSTVEVNCGSLFNRVSCARQSKLCIQYDTNACIDSAEHPRRQGSATSISVGGSYNASLAWSLRSLLSDIVIWKGTAVAIATFQEDRSSTLKCKRELLWAGRVLRQDSNSAFKEHIGRLGRTKGSHALIAQCGWYIPNARTARNGDLIMRKTQSYYQLYWPKGIAPLFTENLGICMVWSLSTTSDIIPTD